MGVRELKLSNLFMDNTTHRYISFAIRLPTILLRTRSSKGLVNRSNFDALTQERLNQSFIYCDLCFSVYTFIFLNWQYEVKYFVGKHDPPIASFISLLSYMRALF